MRAKPLIPIVAAILAAGCCWSSAQATDWLQFGYDPTHSGFNSAEPGYSTPGNTLLYKYALPTAADSAPIYLGNVAVGSATKNVLFVVTKNGTLLALDADAKTLSVLWSKKPTGAGTLTTGSPAVDPGKQYVYAYGLDGYVHKYQVGNGTEVTGGGWPELSTLKPDVEKGAAGLSINVTSGGTFLYSATNGYIGDAGDYQGHLTTINLSTGVQNVFNSQCSNLFLHFVKNGHAGVDDCNFGSANQSYQDGQMSGIWGRPGAVYDPAMDRVYIATGNGLFNANTHGDYEWGDSLLALKHDGTSNSGMPVDSFTPSTYAALYSADDDLGSTSPAILPSTSTTYPHLAIQSGKDGCVRLINLDNMSGAGGPGHIGGELNAATSCTGDAVGGQVRTQPAVWVNPADATTWFFITTDGGLFAYQLSVVGTGIPTLKQPLAAALSNLPGGTSPVVANGVVYYVSNQSPYTVNAVSATTGALLWSEGSPQSIHWQSPIVANGRLYLVDGNSKLLVYALDGIFRNGFGAAANGYK